MSGIMNIKEKTEREKSKDKRKQMVDASYREVVWAKLFCCAFKFYPINV